MRILSLITVGTFLGVFSVGAMATWKLDNDASSLHFISTKNEHINESHYFKEFSGELDKAGELSVVVELASLETNIPIRNERMKEHLFSISKTPQASLTATVPEAVLSMNAGATTTTKIDADITINNKTASYPVNLSVSKDANGHLSATTVQPILVQAGNHDLVPGLGVLQGLAGLTSIGFTSPVTFTVIFEKQ